MLGSLIQSQCTNHAGASYLVLQRKLSFVDQPDDVCFDRGPGGSGVVSLSFVHVQHMVCMAYVGLDEGAVLWAVGRLVKFHQ